ncbi:MAG: thioredoxin family protein [Proteobacteria bacterium]|nr:thioredoxin family protein [Pseudomonadota bacterium]
MARTASTMLPLQTPAPSFSLPDVVSGSEVRLGDFADARGLLVMFVSVHCPYVQHVATALADLGRDYAPSGLGIVAISANDIAAYPQDAPEHLQKMARDLGFVFPVLYDESQAVAKAYTAACTPDFFLFDAQQRLVYRGQLDDSRPGSDTPVTGADLRAAIDALLAGDPIDEAGQKPSMGCNVKWKPGNEPDYFL